MKKTLFDKVWDSHVVSSVKNGPDILYIDKHLIHEVTSPQAFNVLEEKGLIEERVSQQVYSNADGRFLPDRYVEGTCPNCDFEAARGDQCDNCG